jgi:hypothetical protein
VARRWSWTRTTSSARSPPRCGSSRRCARWKTRVAC